MFSIRFCALERIGISQFLAKFDGLRDLFSLMLICPWKVFSLLILNNWGDYINLKDIFFVFVMFSVLCVWVAKGRQKWNVIVPFEGCSVFFFNWVYSFYVTTTFDWQFTAPDYKKVSRPWDILLGMWVMFLVHPTFLFFQKSYIINKEIIENNPSICCRNCTNWQSIIITEVRTITFSFQSKYPSQPATFVVFQSENWKYV